jgi:sugar/nucleoside kinase (ribokinase family)
LEIKLLLKDGNIEMVPVKKSDKVVKTTGAGDTLTGSLVSMLLRGKNVQESLKYAMVASRLSLQTLN